MKREVNSRDIRISALEEEVISIEKKLELQKGERTTASHDAWKSKAKAEFYGDLIGWAVLSVRVVRNEEEQLQRVFECSVTGKAGSKFPPYSRWLGMQANVVDSAPF